MPIFAGIGLFSLRNSMRHSQFRWYQSLIKFRVTTYIRWAIVFHGIPWNCPCYWNWETQTSMEFHGTLHGSLWNSKHVYQSNNIDMDLWCDQNTGHWKYKTCSTAFRKSLRPRRKIKGTVWSTFAQSTPYMNMGTLSCRRFLTGINFGLVTPCALMDLYQIWLWFYFCLLGTESLLERMLTYYQPNT